MTFFSFFFQLFSPESEDPLLGENFLVWKLEGGGGGGGGGGGCQHNILVPPPPPTKTQGPPVPPTEKILATYLKMSNY